MYTIDRKKITIKSVLPFSLRFKHLWKKKCDTLKRDNRTDSLP